MENKVLRWNFVFQYGYVLTNIFNAILLLPLYIKFINATTLGLWLATGNIMAWITTADPGVGDVLQQKIAELKGRKLYSEVSRTIGSGFIAIVIILILSIFLGLGFYYALDTIIDKDLNRYPDLQLAFVISIVATGFSLVSFGLSGINQGMHNSKQVAVAALLSNFLFLIINLVLLFLGFGVISIALSNLLRAFFLNVYNITALLHLLKRQKLSIIFEFQHFKKFIHIFSFTSLSRIISRVSENIDLIILARFIPASFITVFEINRRPINIIQSLIGRHSVALMPLISHQKGKGNRLEILNLVNKQFKYYSYAILLAMFLFSISYFDLIALWAGKNHYAGDKIIYLLVGIFFFYSIGYFMSNIGYALGDIKANSVISMARGLIISLFSYLVASRYGLVGILLVALSVGIAIDFLFFSYRLYSLGYFKLKLLKNITATWSIVIPTGIFLVVIGKFLINNLIAEDAYLFKIIFGGLFFIPFFLISIFLVDTEIRLSIKNYKSKILSNRLVPNS